MTPADAAAGFALSRAAGWNQREEDWTLLLRENPGRFVAAEAPDGRLVGTAGAAGYGRDLAWVCMVLVDKPAQGQGLGTRLMGAVLERLDAFAVVGLDATPQGRPVYEKLGFVEVGTFLRMGMEVAAGAGVGGPATPLAAGHLDAMLRLDGEVFGADRTAVLRWACAQAPAWCLRDADGISAYSCARRGAHSYHLGPVVAPAAGAGLGLVKSALAGAAGRVIVDANTATGDWVESLRALGFREQRPLFRMYRHHARPPGDPERVFAIFGPEFG